MKPAIIKCYNLSKSSKTTKDDFTSTISVPDYRKWKPYVHRPSKRHKVDCGQCGWNWKKLMLKLMVEFLVTDPEVRVRFPALPDFPRSSGSGTASTQPLEYS
jgi:hypothetical protein